MQGLGKYHVFAVCRTAPFEIDFSPLAQLLLLHYAAPHPLRHIDGAQKKLVEWIALLRMMRQQFYGSILTETKPYDTIDRRCGQTKFTLYLHRLTVP